jgi:hypothetical protein
MLSTRTDCCQVTSEELFSNGIHKALCSQIALVVFHMSTGQITIEDKTK